MKMKTRFVERRLQTMPNVYGGSRGVAKPGVKKLFKAGVGKDGIAKPKTGAISGRALTSRPVVQGMDTQGRVLKKAKKYWMWIVAAVIGYFLLKRK